MKCKALEIRDRATFIPALAVSIEPENGEQRFLTHSAGFDPTGPPCILLVKLASAFSNWDPYAWQDSRTMKAAHLYVKDHWDELKDGDVIDVEFINGETDIKKQSQRFDLEGYELQ